MSKILTIPSNLNEIEKTIDLVDGFIIGIKDMCVNTNFCIDIEDLNLLNKIKDKDIFISLNKNMHNKDLEIVKEILIKLNSYNIKGVLYYDVGVLNIYNKLDLNYDLVWSQEHLTTNYNTINYWNSKGAKYANISSDITEEEVIKIIEKSKSKLMVTLFGYLPMFVSKRHIVKNYLEYFKLNDESNINYIEKEDKTYPIIDNSIGTQVYSNNILNGIKSSLNINIDYIVLNSFKVELDKFIIVIEMFKTVNKDNVEEYNEKINSMFTNVDYGFLNTKTIYRVKKNDKKA
ncbi:MAG: U32 family peptidase [Bacilli bacterium]|nr:U32 family peptidase [Bacilli bacterium]